jgi:hypothetical protein
MSEMNCESVTELMPLHAAGDLEAAKACKVAAHLSACEGCRALAAEFAASRSLLAEACALPEFGADFYAGIRSAVLDEIKRDQQTPSTPSLFTTLFGRRLIYAASLALLLLACGLALQHFRRTANESPQQMAKDQPERREQPQPTGAPVQQSREIKQRVTAPPVVLASTNPPKGRSLSSKPSASLRSKRGMTSDSVLHQAAGSHNPLGLIAYEPGVVQRMTNTNGSGIHVNGSRDRAFNVTPGSNEVSRIEIQTADPNIRIIWLTPPKSEAPDPERDKNENGERN